MRQGLLQAEKRCDRGTLELKKIKVPVTSISELGDVVLVMNLFSLCARTAVETFLSAKDNLAVLLFSFFSPLKHLATACLQVACQISEGNTCAFTTTVLFS